MIHAYSSPFGVTPHRAPAEWEQSGLLGGVLALWTSHSSPPKMPSGNSCPCSVVAVNATAGIWPQARSNMSRSFLDFANEGWFTQSMSSRTQGWAHMALRDIDDMSALLSASHVLMALLSSWHRPLPADLKSSPLSTGCLLLPGFLQYLPRALRSFRSVGLSTCDIFGLFVHASSLLMHMLEQSWRLFMFSSGGLLLHCCKAAWMLHLPSKVLALDGSELVVTPWHHPRPILDQHWPESYWQHPTLAHCVRSYPLPSQACSPFNWPGGAGGTGGGP
jgi:hypothetical protein